MAPTPGSTPNASSTIRCPGPGCAPSTDCKAWCAATAPTASNRHAHYLWILMSSRSTRSRPCSNVPPRRPPRHYRKQSDSKPPGSPAIHPNSIPPLHHSPSSPTNPQCRRSADMTTHRAPADPVGADLTRLLKTLKLGALADTLPERAALARQHKLSHIGFLEVLLADEVSRRESRSAALRSAKAGLDPTMRFDTWTTLEDLRYDHTLLGDLTSLRFLDAGQSAIILGPVGVGKTHLATALGHMAIRRRNSVLFARSDKLFTRLRAARLDNTVDAEIRRLTTIDVLIIDDFALRPLGATETSDFYEIIVERHRAKTTIVTSNREPAEWLTMTADTLLAQSAIDRLTATAHTLVIEGPSYRQRTRPGQLDPDHPDEHPQ